MLRLARAAASWLVPLACLLATCSPSAAAPENGRAMGTAGAGEREAVTGMHVAPADERLPGIIGVDDRAPVVESGAPWSAVGQVNVAGYRTRLRYTGTLVSPTAVITAAHCVHLPKQYKTDSIHFVAGLDRGSYKGHGVAKCVRWLARAPVGQWVVGRPQQRLEQAAKRAPYSAFDDAAVIVLAEPIAVTPAPIGDAASVDPDSVLVHAAYPAERRHMLSADTDCRMTRTSSDMRVWLTDCDTSKGSSGGPVLVRAGGELKLVAIMVAGAGSDANAAVTATAWQELLNSATCP